MGSLDRSVEIGRQKSIEEAETAPEFVLQLESQFREAKQQRLRRLTRQVFGDEPFPTENATDYIERVSTDIVQEIICWCENRQRAGDQGRQPMLVFNEIGMGGSGKSSIAHALIKRILTQLERESDSHTSLSQYIEEIGGIDNIVLMPEFDAFKRPPYRRPLEVPLAQAYLLLDETREAINALIAARVAQVASWDHDLKKAYEQLTQRMLNRGEDVSGDLSNVVAIRLLRAITEMEKFEALLDNPYGNTAYALPLESEIDRFLHEIQTLLSPEESISGAEDFQGALTKIRAARASVTAVATENPYRKFDTEAYNAMYDQLVLGHKVASPQFSQAAHNPIDLHLTDKTFEVWAGPNRKIIFPLSGRLDEVLMQNGSVQDEVSLELNTLLHLGDVQITVTQYTSEQMVIEINGQQHHIRLSTSSEAVCQVDSFTFTIPEDGFLPAQKILDPAGRMIASEGIFSPQGEAYKKFQKKWLATLFVHYGARSLRMTNRGDSNDRLERALEDSDSADDQRAIMQNTEETDIAAQARQIDRTNSRNTQITNLDEPEIWLIGMLMGTMEIPEELAAALVSSWEQAMFALLPRAGARSPVLCTYIERQTLSKVHKQFQALAVRNKILIHAANLHDLAFIRVHIPRLADMMPATALLDRSEMPDRMPRPISEAIGHEDQLVVKRYLPSLREQYDQDGRFRMGWVKRWIDDFFNFQRALFKRGYYDTDASLLDNYGYVNREGQETLVAGIRQTRSIVPRGSVDQMVLIQMENWYPVPESFPDELVAYFQERRLDFIQSIPNLLQQKDNSVLDQPAPERPTDLPTRERLLRTARQHIADVAIHNLYHTLSPLYRDNTGDLIQNHPTIWLHALANSGVISPATAEGRFIHALCENQDGFDMAGIDFTDIKTTRQWLKTIMEKANLPFLRLIDLHFLAILLTYPWQEQTQQQRRSA